MSTMRARRVSGQLLANRAVVATAAALAGVLATAVGAGLGIRHLQKVGLAPASVVGVMLLVLGFALLVSAVVVSWRALHRWWRLVLLPVGLIGLVLIWCIAQAVMYTNVPRTTLGSVTPAARGLAYSDVTFPARDGVRLSAWLVPSHNRAMVILLHGAGENRTATLAQAEVLARHGYGAPMLDARGQGRSAGAGMELGWRGTRTSTVR